MRQTGMRNRIVEQDSGTVYFAEYRAVWKHWHAMSESKEELLYLPFVD